MKVDPHFLCWQNGNFGSSLPVNISSSASVVYIRLVLFCGISVAVPFHSKAWWFA